MDFSVRSRTEELMDNPNMGIEELKRAYADINLCNRLLGGDAITIKEVWRLVKKDSKKSYTILDVGCGDGTMLIKLSNFLNKKGISHKMIGVELRDDVLAMAKVKAKDHPQLSFQKKDILKMADEPTCDILINTLTLHHFQEERIEAFLEKITNLAGTAVVINDLQRSKLAYFLFMVFGFFLMKSSVAKHDGLVSIRRSFKRQELLGLTKKIPNVTHTIRWKWAFRYVWVMEFNRHIN